MRKEESLTTQKPTLPQILAETCKIGIIQSNLVPMLAGLTLALYTYQISLFEKLPEMLFALIGSIFVMGAAGAFNNLYDRDIDSIMERTKNRPTVTGAIKPKTVLWLGICMSILGIAALAFTTPLAAFLGFLGLFLCCPIYDVEQEKNNL